MSPVTTRKYDNTIAGRGTVSVWLVKIRTAKSSQKKGAHASSAVLADDSPVGVRNAVDAVISRSRDEIAHHSEIGCECSHLSFLVRLFGTVADLR